MKKFLLTSVAALTLASAASAGNLDPVVVDTPVLAATAPAGPDWGGFYLGATYGFSTGGRTDYINPDFSYPDLTSGSSYGAFAGYNIQRNNLVFGGEIAYSTVTNPSFGPVAFPASTFSYFLDAKARVGVALGKSLVYGFAGYSMTHYTQTNVANNWDMDGMNYGVGVDILLGEKFIIGAEYIVRDVSGATTINPAQTQESNLQAVQIRAGFKF